MGVFHFLDVEPGDCSIIEHPSGRTSVIDICNARSVGPSLNTLASFAARKNQSKQYEADTVLGAFAPSPQQGLLSDLVQTGRKAGVYETVLGTFVPQPRLGLLSSARRFQNISAVVNPIQYMRDRGITNVFRFILTHPDMDHMDGIKDFFEEYQPYNFWDVENKCKKDFSNGFRYREEDWKFYEQLRTNTQSNSVKRMTLYAGSSGSLYNKDGQNGECHDQLYILSPTYEIIKEASYTDDYNDACYVILYITSAGRILFCGDSHNKTWNYILDHHLDAIRNVDVMIAPHHGRDSGRDRDFLSEVKPRLTLFGRAPSKHLAYDAWRSRNLDYMTSKQAGTVIVDANGRQMEIYVTNEGFARQRCAWPTYSAKFRAWHVGSLESMSLY